MKENKQYYVCKSMKELLAFTKAKRKQRAHQHYEMAKAYGPCSGMGNRRYKVKQKSTFLKGKSYAYKGRWNYYAVDPNGHYKLNTN
jgi:hypothetical protein